MLDEALATVLRLGHPPGLTVAGRTDAGVHARGQVAHVDVSAGAWLAVGQGLLGRLRGVLPADIRVTSVGVAPADFDARFGATSRRYAYRLSDDPAGVEPLLRRSTVRHSRPLDVSLMGEAAKHLLGEHDFAAFCRKREGASTIRTVVAFDWSREPDGLVVGRVVADAFCHNMVRATVGACVAVGEGRHAPAWVGGVLASAARSSAVTVMPPHGLVLEEVTYPPDAELASRVGETRRFRG